MKNYQKKIIKIKPLQNKKNNFYKNNTLYILLKKLINFNIKIFHHK